MLFRLLAFILLISASAYAQTAHFDFSSSDDLFTTSGNPPSGTPVADDPVQQVDDESVADTNLRYRSAIADSPNWRSPGSMLQPSLDFDGTQDAFGLITDAGSLKTLDSIINNNAFTLIIAFRAQAISTTALSSWDNAFLISDSDGYWGAFTKDVSGTKRVFCYNYDTNEDVVGFDVSVDTNYVLMCRKDGTTLYGSLNNGTEVSTASGNTGSVANTVNVGVNSYASAFYNGFIGEIKVWDTSNAGGSLATELSTFMTDWVTGGAAGSIQFTSATFNVGEAAGTAAITISRTGGSSGIVGVTFDTSNGTASSASDYTAVVGGAVSFGDGVTTNQTVNVTITNDVDPESSETVNLAITSATGGATLGTPNTAVLTISDNDSGGGSVPATFLNLP